jgi:anti-anti-sigma factor
MMREPSPIDRRELGGDRGAAARWVVELVRNEDQTVADAPPPRSTRAGTREQVGGDLPRHLAPGTPGPGGRMSRLEVRAEPEFGNVRIRLTGELDISTADSLERRLAELEEAGPQTIVLDLSDLAFMDSTGLRLIVTADLRMRADRRRLRLVRGPEAVQRVFRLALLEERLSFLDEGEAPAEGGRDGA